MCHLNFILFLSTIKYTPVISTTASPLFVMRAMGRESTMSAPRLYEPQLLLYLCRRAHKVKKIREETRSSCIKSDDGGPFKFQWRNTPVIST